MTSVVCPYCFDRSPAARLPYRCRMSATGVRGARPCPAELDTIWADFTGPSVPPALKMRGPVFTAARGPGRRLAPNGGGSRADCPARGGSAPVRVCLRCHSDFPSDYCDQDTRITALLGPKASGKSTCVSVLLGELRGRVGRAYGASVTAMGGETRRRDRELAEDLYDRLRLPEATGPAALGFDDPLQVRAVRDRLPSDDGPPPPSHAPADAPKSGPRPLRVEDPLLWLPGLGGLLPRTGGSAGTGSRTGSEGNS
ncbi:hypothetical protein OG753_31645 [Streptomyces sp. NBC_00029]|uniref:hypothetical protein n=1 Tax=Streptomyces sp. NBC_00029 TaxID=2903613 RepID=UPI00324BDA75